MAGSAHLIGGKRLVGCVLALGLAFTLFSLLFLRAGSHFWLCLSLSVGALGWVAVLAEPGDMHAALGCGDARGWMHTVTIGILSAVALYAIFFAGNWAARRIFPSGVSDIESVYRLGAGTPRWVIAALLMLVVGPGEEIIWRGYVQRRLSAEFAWNGTAASVLAYGGVHIATGNLTLVLAALVCGGFWALLYRRFGSLRINIVSHACWAVGIFVWFPVS